MNFCFSEKEINDMLKDFIILAIGWFISRYYYQKSEKDFRNESVDRRLYDDVILTLVEANNKRTDLRVRREESGKPVGIIAELQAQLSGSSKMTASLTVLSA